MIKYAYFREFSMERQADNTELFQTIQKAGIEKHNIFFDDLDTNESLKELLEDFLQKDDVLLLRSWSDIAGSTKALKKVMDYLQEKQVKVCSLEEDKISTKSYYSSFKQSQSLLMYYNELARKRGYSAALEAKRIGRPRLSEQTDKALSLYLTKKYSANEIAKSCGISTSTLFRAVKAYKEELKKDIEKRKKSIAEAEAIDKELEKSTS